MAAAKKLSPEQIVAPPRNAEKMEAQGAVKALARPEIDTLGVTTPLPATRRSGG